MNAKPSRNHLRNWRLVLSLSFVTFVVLSGFFATAGALDLIKPPGNVGTQGDDRPSQIQVEGSNLMLPVDRIINNFQNGTAASLGIGAFFIALAGLRYMAARNDAKKLTTVKHAILNVTVGTAIIVGGYTVVLAILALLYELSKNAV